MPVSPAFVFLAVWHERAGLLCTCAAFVHPCTCFVSSNNTRCSNFETHKFTLYLSLKLDTAPFCSGLSPGRLTQTQLQVFYLSARR